MFVSYNEIMHFDNNVDGAIKFINWICGNLYTKNDVLYAIASIFKYNNIREEFTTLYDEFYTMLGRREMDKYGEYTRICGQIGLRYNFYCNGYIKI